VNREPTPLIAVVGTLAAFRAMLRKVPPEERANYFHASSVERARGRTFSQVVHVGGPLTPQQWEIDAELRFRLRKQVTG
jgi:hypothetical protein